MKRRVRSEVNGFVRSAVCGRVRSYVTMRCDMCITSSIKCELRSWVFNSYRSACS